VVALSAVLGACAAASPPTAAAANTVVTLTFDNGLLSQKALQPLLKQHGLRATFFVNSGHIATDSYYYMSWEHLQSLYADGHEIGGHTLTHADPSKLSPDERRREVCEDRANLLQHGFPAANFAHPLGVDSIGVAIVQGCGYNSARTLGGIREPGCPACPYAERIPPANPYGTLASSVVKSTTSLEALQSFVTQAESNGGGWVQLVFTNVCDGCSEYSVSQATMNAFVPWLAARGGQGTVVKTVQDVIGGALQAPPSGVFIPGLTGAKDTIRPIVVSLSVTRKAFAVARTSTPVAARVRRGTAFRYTISEPARVRLLIQRKTRRKSCARRRRGSKRRRCVRYRSVGALLRSARQLRNRTTFSGRIGRKRLRVGSYRALVAATDAAGNRSRSRAAGFKVVRP
jgi:hypothetical protein